MNRLQMIAPLLLSLVLAALAPAAEAGIGTGGSGRGARGSPWLTRPPSLIGPEPVFDATRACPAAAAIRL